jgi:hypothetical protein
MKNEKYMYPLQDLLLFHENSWLCCLLLKYAWLHSSCLLHDSEIKLGLGVGSWLDDNLVSVVGDWNTLDGMPFKKLNIANGGALMRTFTE